MLGAHIRNTPFRELHVTIGGFAKLCISLRFRHYNLSTLRILVARISAVSDSLGKLSA
jgi:hypothetical protein